jgi:hypothetical protein
MPTAYLRKHFGPGEEGRAVTQRVVRNHPEGGFCGHRGGGQGACPY